MCNNANSLGNVAETTTLLRANTSAFTKTWLMILILVGIRVSFHWGGKRMWFKGQSILCMIHFKPCVVTPHIHQTCAVILISVAFGPIIIHRVSLFSCNSKTPKKQTLHLIITHRLPPKAPGDTAAERTQRCVMSKYTAQGDTNNGLTTQYTLWYAGRLLKFSRTRLVSARM